jgi:flagellar basal-body rod protein FlgC
MLSTGVPLSGMQAASLRLAASASNIANKDSGGALPAADRTSAGSQAYRPLHVQQTSAGSGGGTVATVNNSEPSFVAKYDPRAPYANAQGQVATPNVDVLNEILNISTGKTDFVANVKVAEAVNHMVKQLFDLGNDKG